MVATILIVDDNAQVRALLRGARGPGVGPPRGGRGGGRRRGDATGPGTPARYRAAGPRHAAGQRPGGPAADQDGATRDQGYYRDRARRRRLSPGGGGPWRRCLLP